MCHVVLLCARCSYFGSMALFDLIVMQTSVCSSIASFYERSGTPYHLMVLSFLECPSLKLVCKHIILLLAFATMSSFKAKYYAIFSDIIYFKSYAGSLR